MAVFSGLLVEEDPSLLSSRIHLLRDRERERKSERERERERGESHDRCPNSTGAGTRRRCGPFYANFRKSRHSAATSATITAIKGGGGDKIRGAPRGIPSRDIAPRLPSFQYKMRNSDTVEKEREETKSWISVRWKGEESMIFLFFFCDNWNLRNLFIGQRSTTSDYLITLWNTPWRLWFYMGWKREDLIT